MVVYTQDFFANSSMNVVALAALKMRYPPDETTGRAARWNCDMLEVIQVRASLKENGGCDNRVMDVHVAHLGLA